MKTKVIIIAIILFFSSKADASINIDQVKALAEEAYTRSDFNALYSLGKILYEDGKHEEGEALLFVSCEEGKNKEACSYLNGISSSYNQENKSINKIDSNQKQLLMSNEFKRGNEFYEKKDYTESFPIFSHLCIYEEYEPACYMLGLSYQYGNGVKEDPHKALKIYRKYSKVHDGYKIQEARTLEYHMDYSDKTMNEAMTIYNGLTNSKIEWVAKASKAAIERIPIYNLIDRYLKIMSDYRADKIKYDTFHQEWNKINTNQVPADLRDKFVSMRDICLKDYKNSDSPLLDIAKSTGMTAVKTFIGGLAGLGESVVGIVSDYAGRDQVYNECKQRREYFFNELEKYQLSGGWYDKKIGLYFPKK